MFDRVTSLNGLSSLVSKLSNMSMLVTIIKKIIQSVCSVLHSYWNYLQLFFLSTEYSFLWAKTLHQKSPCFHYCQMSSESCCSKLFFTATRDFLFFPFQYLLKVFLISNSYLKWLNFFQYFTFSKLFRYKMSWQRWSGNM